MSWLEDARRVVDAAVRGNYPPQLTPQMVSALLDLGEAADGLLEAAIDVLAEPGSGAEASHWQSAYAAEDALARVRDLAGGA